MKRLIICLGILLANIAMAAAQDAFADGNSSAKKSQLSNSDTTKKFDLTSTSQVDNFVGNRLGAYMLLDWLFMSDKPEDTTQLGIEAELGGRYHLTNWLYGGLGLGYMYNEVDYDGYMGYDNKSHYIYIPLHIGVQVNLFKEGGIFCNTGPQFGWLVASKFDDEKVDLSDEDTAYTNWAVRFGVKWNSGEIYALYQTGISKNMKDVEFWGVGLGFCF